MAVVVRQRAAPRTTSTRLPAARPHAARRPEAEQGPAAGRQHRAAPGAALAQPRGRLHGRGRRPSRRLGRVLLLARAQGPQAGQAALRRAGLALGGLRGDGGRRGRQRLRRRPGRLAPAPARQAADDALLRPHGRPGATPAGPAAELETGAAAAGFLPAFLPGRALTGPATRQSNINITWALTL